MGNIFTTAVLLVLRLDSSSAQFCSDANGMEVGESGFQDMILPDSKTSFIRKGSDENCPCAYVSRLDVSSTSSYNAIPNLKIKVAMEENG